MITHRSIALLSALAALPGCANGVRGYPSLAPRAIEHDVSPAGAGPAAAVETPPLPSLAEITTIVASAQAGDTAFRKALDNARATIEAGRGAPAGSEAWIAAQLAYSEADHARRPVGEALAELDRRRREAITAGKGDEDAAIVDATRQVQAIDEAERAILSALIPA